MMVVGVSMVKDEIDFIERTIEHMGAHLDGLLIFDNGSSDGTREYLEAKPWVLVMDDPEPAYYQADKMTALATIAREHHGATWIVPFDADEIWLPNDGRERIADQLMRAPAEALLFEANVLDHVANGDPLMPYRRREQLPLRKVACRAVEGLSILQGNHGATFPGVDTPLAITGRLQVRHYPYRSPEQFIKKARNGAAAYAASDLPEDVGAHWRQYGKLSDEQLREVFFEWFHSADPGSDPSLVHNPPPCLSRS